MTSVEERLKLKRGQVDSWSTREKLCLASSVVRSGNQNWMSVSRSLRGFGAEPGRPADWFSQKSCAVQYDNLLTQIETPKRKKRGADGSRAEGVDLTPAEVIVKSLTGERIEELRKLMAEARAVYMKEKEELFLIQNGLADEKLENEMLIQIQEENKQKEAKQEEYQKWLRQREERKQEMEKACRPHAAQQHARGGSVRRPSNQSEIGSEADNVESPSSSDQPAASEETVEAKPASTPTSPLLTSLLESPSPVTGPQSSSILHSAITSQRGASPTITSLLNSSPGVPSSSTSVPLSPNLKSLVSNALAGHDDVPKPQPTSSASSSPTLSMLLGLPPSTPGKLPQLPYSATNQPTSTPTSKPGDVDDKATVEHQPEVEGPKPMEQCQTAVEPSLGVWDCSSPKEDLPSVESLPEVEDPKPLDQSEQSNPQQLDGPESSEQSQAAAKCPTEDSLKSLQDPQPTLKCLPQVGEPIALENCHLAEEIPPEVKNSESHEQSFSTGPSLSTTQASNSPEPNSAQEPNQHIQNPTSKVEGLKSPGQCLVEICKPIEGFQPIVNPPSEVDGIKSPEQHQVESPKPLEMCQPTVESSSKVTVVEYSEQLQVEKSEPLGLCQPTADRPPSLEHSLSLLETSESGESLPKSPEASPASKLESSEMSSQVIHSEALQDGDPTLELPSSQDNPPTDKDPLKKETLPDLSNMEIVLPVDTEVKGSEADNKVNLDSTDVQQMSTDELEYVVDSSIDVVLQEFGTEGLVDEMVYIVSSDVETDIGNMLEAAETNEASVTEQGEGTTEPVIKKENEDIRPQEIKQEKIESEPVSVVVHQPANPSPQRSINTPSSAAPSPRISHRPAKGSMGPRKILMEDEEASKLDTTPRVGDIQQLEGDSETLSREALDLENASVLIVQDNGEVVKLSESGQTTSIIDNIHVIQDSSSNNVLVVPHDDILKDSEVDSNQSSKSATEESGDDSNDADKEVLPSPKKDEQQIESRSPKRSPRKSTDKNEVHEKKVDDCTSKPEVSPIKSIAIPPSQTADIEPSQSKEETKEVEPNHQEKTSEIAEDTIGSGTHNEPLSPREGLKKKKALSPPKREKSPVISESSNEVASEEDSSKEEGTDGTKKEDDLHVEEREAGKQESSSTVNIQVVDDGTRHTNTEVRNKDDKSVRAETPSIEEDNRKELEQQPPPVKRGRGRYARESTSNHDSVPNSPVPSGATHDDEKEHRAWKKSIMLVYNRIAAHKNASIFLKPITDDIAPGYSSMVYRPLDLQTIKKNLESGQIRTTDEFQRDILLMFNNAIMYNKRDSQIYDMAREMQDEGVAHLNEYKSTQLYVSTVGAEGGHQLSRRGTRTADKREQDSDSFGTRRGAVKGNLSRGGVFSSNLLGKRKRSLPDDNRVTPKRRKDDD